MWAVSEKLFAGAFEQVCGRGKQVSAPYTFEMPQTLWSRFFLFDLD
jgi:hypothetical protein